MQNKQNGFTLHIILPFIVIIVVGTIGVITLMHSMATTDGQLSKKEIALIAKEESVKDDGPSDSGVAELEEGMSDIPGTTVANDPHSTLNLRIASWNVYKYNKKDVAANAAKIMKKTDVLGLQEATLFGGKLIKKVACPTCAYEMYPKEKGTPKKLAIIWNKTKFTQLSNGYKQLTTQNAIKKYVVWVKLRENTSHKVFYVLNTHAPFNATTTKGELQNDSDGVAYNAYMTLLAQKIAELQNDGLPIFLTGDLNADFRTDKCTTLALPCKSLSIGLSVKSGWEYLQLKGMKKSTGTASSKRIIDYVMSWNQSNITYQSMAILYGGTGKGWGGSDHKPILLHLTIGQSAL